jgi:dihydroorotate dehydrogenase
VETLPHAREAGGLSGAPLAKRATSVIARLHYALQGALPIIGVGGIMDTAGATEKIEAGASLIQIYSGFVYRGPHLVREIAQVLCSADGRRVDVAGAA